MELPAMFEDNHQTRTSPLKQVAEITPLSRMARKMQTKGSDNNLAWMNDIYVVDYTNQSGFAIISADTRLDLILAYSDKGSFDESADIPGLAGLVSNIPDYAKLRLADWDSLIDPNPPGSEYYVDRSSVVNTQTTNQGPFITTKWGQLEPFSKYTDGPLYGPTIAVVQLMAYYNCPPAITNLNSSTITYFNWPLDKGYVFGPILEMYPESVERVARAAEKVCQRLFVSLPQMTDGGSLTTTEVKNILPEFDYDIDGVQNYSLSAIYADLNKNRPVIMTGFNKSSATVGITEASGWIVDGYQNTNITYQHDRVWYNGLGVELRREDRGRSTETRQLLHCNWGWDGRGDGYFTPGLFAPQQAQSYDFPTLTTPDHRNYRFAVTQCTNIRPIYLPK